MTTPERVCKAYAVRLKNELARYESGLQTDIATRERVERESLKRFNTEQRRGRWETKKNQQYRASLSHEIRTTTRVIENCRLKQQSFEQLTSSLQITDRCFLSPHASMQNFSLDETRAYSGFCITPLTWPPGEAFSDFENILERASNFCMCKGYVCCKVCRRGFEPGELELWARGLIVSFGTSDNICNPCAYGLNRECFGCVSCLEEWPLQSWCEDCWRLIELECYHVRERGSVTKKLIEDLSRATKKGDIKRLQRLQHTLELINHQLENAHA